MSIRSGDTACIRFICNRIDPALPFYTPGGSFFVNGASRFPEATSAAGRKEPCSVCRSYGYESVALIPIRLGDQILGLIYVADPRDDRVPQEMVQILQNGALQLGAAIKRVHAEEELRKSNEVLEERVKIRTAELAAINRELVRQMAEREQVESALRKSENELRLLSGRLLSAEEKERKRIARELHDGIGFDPEQVVSLERSERGVGLASMRERTELTGGQFFISSGRQIGTTIRIVWSLTLGEQSVSP